MPSAWVPLELARTTSADVAALPAPTWGRCWPPTRQGRVPPAPAAQGDGSDGGHVGGRWGMGFRRAPACDSIAGADETTVKPRLTAVTDPPVPDATPPPGIRSDRPNGSGQTRPCVVGMTRRTLLNSIFSTLRIESCRQIQKDLATAFQAVFQYSLAAGLHLSAKESQQPSAASPKATSNLSEKDGLKTKHRNLQSTDVRAPPQPHWSDSSAGPPPCRRAPPQRSKHRPRYICDSPAPCPPDSHR